MSSAKKYYYPRLSDKDYGVFRLSGPGLANCMFFAAKAYVACKEADGLFISPTWQKFSIGPYLRRERDKRAYISLFKKAGISGIKKIFLILDSKLHPSKFEVFSDLGNYFTDLQPYQSAIRHYFESIVNPYTIELVPSHLGDRIAIHVRLGDYVPQLRVPIEWYVSVVEEILKLNPDQKFLLFSDGSDTELKDLLAIPSVERVFYGNAFADMWAISKCKLLIASDSTFSAWGAFLGNVPILFNRRHFPPVYGESGIEHVLGESAKIPSSVVSLLK